MEEISIYQAPEGQDLEMIRKGNQLIEARYNLSTFQQLLLIELLPQINTYDEDFQDYRIDIAEFAKTNEMGQNKEIYKRVQEALESLVTEPVKLINGDDVFSTAWLSSVKYRKGRGYADVSFHPDLKPLLLLMKSHYTEYPKDAIRGLKSKYGFRFYDWLASYKYKGNGGVFYRTFTVAEIREKIALRKDEYTFFKDLRVRVIDPAIKDINDNTDLRVLDVEYIKSGRSFDEIKITAEPKKQRQLAISEESEPKQIKELTAPKSMPEEQKLESPLLDKLTTVGVSVSTAKKWLEKFGESHIKQNLAYSMAKQKEGKVKTSFTGYLAKSIEGNWGEGFEDVVKKSIDHGLELVRAIRAGETAAARHTLTILTTGDQRKEQEAEENRKRVAEEKARIFAIFESQSESMQDVILDAVESKNEQNKALLDNLRGHRAKGNFKTYQTKSSEKFKEAMQENGLV